PTCRVGLDGDCMNVRTSSYWSDKSVPILHFDEPLRTSGELSQIRGCNQTHIDKFPDVSVSLDNAQERHREIDDQRRTKIPTSQRTKQLHEPSNYRGLVGRLPNKVTISTEPNGQYDVIQVFVASKNELN